MRSFGQSALIGLVMLCSSAACAPMTFSNEGEIDFETYHSVLVSVDAPLPGGGSEYLAGELRESSGFETVTTDPAAAVRLVLTVTVGVSERTTVDSEGVSTTEYDGSADFSAATPSGRAILSGSEEDTSDTHDEAAEDVLDEVALHFLPPYRI